MRLPPVCSCWFLAFFVFLALPPSSGHADCSCTVGSNGVNIIGFELIATQCPVPPFSDSKVYTYLVNPIQCSGTALYKYSTYGDTMGSPAALINFYVSNGYRVLRNPSGTHLIVVQGGRYPFNGSISGVNLASAGAGVYYATPATSIDQYCTARPVADQNQDGIPDCLEQPAMDPPKNLGPPCLIN